MAQEKSSNWIPVVAMVAIVAIVGIVGLILNHDGSNEKQAGEQVMKSIEEEDESMKALAEDLLEDIDTSSIDDLSDGELTNLLEEYSEGDLAGMAQGPCGVARQIMREELAFRLSGRNFNSKRLAVAVRYHSRNC